MRFGGKMLSLGILAFVAAQTEPDLSWKSVPDDAFDFVATTTDKADWMVQHRAVLRELMERPQIHTFWIKIDYSNVKTERARFSLEKVTFYCETDRVAPTSQTSYSADGSIIQAGGNALPMEDIVPGSAF
jgi:hypothetical protein